LVGDPLHIEIIAKCPRRLLFRQMPDQSHRPEKLNA
jgi:hypothetical protein